MKKYSFKYAYLSDDGLYRYNLIREWDQNEPRINYVMFNPSRADDDRDDPTTEKCVSIAKLNGFGSMSLTNLFAWRAPEPSCINADTMKFIGELNNDFISVIANSCDCVVAAWGNNGTRFPERVAYVTGILNDIAAKKLRVLGYTSQQQPIHPRAVFYPNVVLKKWELVEVAGR